MGDYTVHTMARSEMDLAGRKIISISLSGDFFCFPQDAVEKLERELTGKRLDQA